MKKRPAQAEPEPVKCRYCGEAIIATEPSRECSGGYMHKDCFKEHWTKVDERFAAWRKQIGNAP